MANLQTPLVDLVGARTVNAFQKAFGWEKPTVEVLLRHYPFRYVKRGEYTPLRAAQVGSLVTVAGSIKSITKQQARSNRKLSWVLMEVNDGEVDFTIKFFNQNWRATNTRVGQWGIFSGELETFRGRYQLVHPEISLYGDEESAEKDIEKFSGTYLPFYHSAKSVRNAKIIKAVDMVIESLDEIPDYLPDEILQAENFCDLKSALIEVHHKTSEENLTRALARLKFDEAFLLQTLLGERRNERKAIKTKLRTLTRPEVLTIFEEHLPFTYTDGQREVIAEIDQDLASDTPMHRLLQGEVGSGKTVIALRTMLKVISTGGQVALIAPTQVLANQHFLTFQKLLKEQSLGATLLAGPGAINIALLTGATSAKERSATKANLANGEIDLIIGTHALISEGINFHDLALVVVDEQHRFGVEQRDALRMKAKYPPHILVMTATPIPRTVAMTFFGDLDISTLRQLPSNRSPIATHLVQVKNQPKTLERTWQRAREEVAQGRQVYIVTPRIGEGGPYQPIKVELDEDLIAFSKEIGWELAAGEGELSKDQSVTALYQAYESLASTVFADLKLGILHGGLSNEEKDLVMGQFAANEIQILFATTVIEVGVDVPNATMMVIYDADRFGIAQLHQLRGRIGRGAHSSLAILLTSAATDSLTYQRLTQVAQTTSGFDLANLDLEYRKEGNILGAEQSGTRSLLLLLRVIEDITVIEKAKSYSDQLLAKDPKLTAYPLLVNALAEVKAQEAASYLEKS